MSTLGVDLVEAATEGEFVLTVGTTVAPRMSYADGLEERNMKRQSILAFVTASAFGMLCLDAERASADLTFDDGGTHTVNWTVDDQVVVRNSPLSQPTTLDLVTGGGLKDYLYVYDSSQVDMSGGAIGNNLYAYQNSLVSISGGTIGISVGGFLVAYDSSQVDMSGGEIGSYLYAHQSSQVSISGGTIDGPLAVSDSSQADISGGSMVCLFASQSSQVSISGGTISGYLSVYDSSQVDMSGGSLNDLYAHDSSQIIIEGSGFNYPYGTLTGSGFLTGVLANGDLMSASFYTSDNGRIVLTPVPVPGAALLGAIGLSFAGWRLRRRTT